MKKLGLFNIEGVQAANQEQEKQPIATIARMRELSKGKDTYYIPGGKREGIEKDEENYIYKNVVLI